MRFNEWFHESAQRPAQGINKRLLERFGKYRVYVVNGEAVRNSSKAAEEFGGSSLHAYLPKVVPENEIWIEDEVKADERDVLVASALHQLKWLERGVSPSKAYSKGLKWEKRMREAALLSKDKPASTDESYPKHLRLGKYGFIKGEDVDVYIVDGEEVRDHFKTDFIEGGHGYVYPWIPNDEIWLEQGPHLDDEGPYLLLHEFVERIEMKYDGVPYHAAHRTASRIEFQMRKRGNFTKDDALALTKKKAEELI